VVTRFFQALRGRDYFLSKLVILVVCFALFCTSLWHRKSHRITSQQLTLQQLRSSYPLPTFALVVEAGRRMYLPRDDTWGERSRAAALSLLRAKPPKGGDAEPRD